MKASELNTAVFTFGRFNPPTIGHARLVDMIKRQPGKPYVFLSHTQKPKTDPLSYGQKLTYAKSSFPEVTIGDFGTKNIIQVLQKLESLGYTNVIMVVGSDRVEQFKGFVPKYNGKEYKFDTIRIISAGERDPDSEGIEGMSASKMRQFASDGDFENFKTGVINKSDAKKMYNDVRSGMGLNEVKTTMIKRIMPAESINEALENKPDVYVDMDGVIADFFSALAKFRGTSHWKDEGNMSVEDSIKAIAGTDFFSTLPVFPNANQLISMVKNFTGGEWYICSSPLRGDHENSKKHKLNWLSTNGFDPVQTIITGRKEKHATTKDNQSFRPNILIDDKPSNIERWQMKNGIGLRYQANKDSLSRVQRALETMKDYMAKKQGPWTPEEVRKVNSAIDSGSQIPEGLNEYGRIVQGINTTVDIGTDAIKKQSGKMGFKVDKDGYPPILKTSYANKKISEVLQEDELKFQNEKGNLSLNTLPGTKKWQKAKKNSKPGTQDWFKTWRTMPFLTKGRKNHYMLPIKEKISILTHNISLLEKWSKKYKKSINCNDPKGFSQKAHCAGKKK